jgi:uncharacterized protein YbgA (DUF1722 family)/uncharacterized protein YbbK (DUF523 family)
MNKIIKPNVVVSKCLGFAACRYNGITIPDRFVDKLKPYVNFITICPEEEIGLGVPRDPITIVSAKGVKLLLQPTTGKDITGKMTSFVEQFLSSLKDIDGFILKYKSPSCGIKAVKIFPSMEATIPIRRGSGFFGGEVIERFSDLAVEDEARLKNFKIREHFLTKLFTLARFREAKKAKAMRELVRFHTVHKFLLLAYNQKELRQLGKITANPKKQPLDNVLAHYESHLKQALNRAPRYTSNINVLMHSLGYFSKNLSAKEKAFFLEMLEKYRTNKIPLSAVNSIINSWIFRFGNEYLMDQIFFQPYPEDFIEITESSKGRDAVRP